MTESNPYQSPETSVDDNENQVSKAEEQTSDVQGLGGWLILVGLGIIISPIKIVAQIYPIYSQIFQNGAWEALTSPVSEGYNPLWAPIIIGEIVVNSALVLSWLIIAYLFFTKKKLLPAWYIGVIIFTLVFILIDAFSIQLILPDEKIFDPETSKEILRSVVSIIIWVPYMLVSKRVKATFVN